MFGHKKKMWYYESISLLLWGIMCRKNEIKSYRYIWNFRRWLSYNKYSWKALHHVNAEGTPHTWSNIHTRTRIQLTQQKRSRTLAKNVKKFVSNQKVRSVSV